MNTKKINRKMLVCTLTVISLLLLTCNVLVIVQSEINNEDSPLFSVRTENAIDNPIDITVSYLKQLSSVSEDKTENENEPDSILYGDAETLADSCMCSTIFEWTCTGTCSGQSCDGGSTCSVTCPYSCSGTCGSTLSCGACIEKDPRPEPVPPDEPYLPPPVHIHPAWEGFTQWGHPQHCEVHL